MAGAPGVAILDVRDADAFARGHWPGAGHVPLAELEARRTELPPRDVAVTVVAASGDAAREAAGAVEALGYADVRWLDAAVAGAPGADDRSPAARLWRPAPFLESALPRLVECVPGGRVLDLAAGAGRESAFLALHGFAVEAVDDDAEILDRAAALARRFGAHITTTVLDLERRQVTLAESAYQVVTVFRFLHRPLFRAIERAIAPGGFLVYETYRRGQERFGRPKHPRFLLDDGELSSAFPGLVVEQYEEPGPEGGPITARLLARKPEASS
jgi:rhodanese-related sulfurtransferase